MMSFMNWRMNMSWKYRMYQILSLLRRMRRPYCWVFGHLWVEDNDETTHCDICDVWQGDVTLNLRQYND